MNDKSTLSRLMAEREFLRSHIDLFKNYPEETRKYHGSPQDALARTMTAIEDIEAKIEELNRDSSQ